MPRSEYQLFPNYTSELEEIKSNGINEALLSKIIEKHVHNSTYNKSLYKRYMTLENGVPIFRREPRFKIPEVDGKQPHQINNKINNDYFSEIIDFKVGYFAGKPISYSYSRTEESEEDTGSMEAVKEARKAISDFSTLNNMYDVDMEVTKHAAICGYAGRLFYHDTDGNERVMALPGYEVIILSSTAITEPEYGIRYYSTEDINGHEYLVVEYYDNQEIQIYEGQLHALTKKKSIKNLYGFCPLQGIPNNNEMTGDAEKVLSEIDAYDRVVSDSSNQIEGQVHSKEIYENVNISPEEIALGNYTGALSFHNGTGNGRIYKLESNINDAFVEHHLERLTDNIYRFSKTPNLNDLEFGTSSGIALKFKLTGLEAKCGMFQAKMMSAGVYMFKLLAGSWSKKGLDIDPLQCIMEFKRNLPIDLLAEAQTAQHLIGAGLPKEFVYSLLSSVDDVDYIMQLIEKEMNNIPSLETMTLEDFGVEEDTEKTKNEEKIDKNSK